MIAHSGAAVKIRTIVTSLAAALTVVLLLFLGLTALAQYVFLERRIHYR